MKKTGERISVSAKRRLIGRGFSIRGTWIDRCPKKEYDSFELISGRGMGKGLQLHKVEDFVD
jgi:hypothetical protein